MATQCFQLEEVEALHFPERMVACDLKSGRYGQFTKICEFSMSSLLLTLTDMNLSKSRLSKTKPHVSKSRTINPLVLHFTHDIEIGLSLIIKIKKMFRRWFNLGQTSSRQSNCITIHIQNVVVQLYFKR